MLKEHLRKSRLLDSILAARDAKVPLADAWVRRKAPGRAGVDMTASAPNLKQLTRASSSVDRGVTIGTAAGSEQGATENRAPSGSGSVFPQWLLSRSDFKDISDVPIQTAVMRRENAEAYIREEESLEPRCALTVTPLRRHPVCLL